MDKKSPNFMELIFKHMNINNFTQFILIMVVFAVTGSLALLATFEFMETFGIDSVNTNPYFFWPLRIIFLFFVYQILLLLVSIPFGQFRYFLQFEKKILRRFGVKIKLDR